jgi:hypothetical protein
LRIFSASFGAGMVGSHRMIDVIPGGDERPDQEDVRAPGPQAAGADQAIPSAEFPRLVQRCYPAVPMVH